MSVTLLNDGVSSIPYSADILRTGFTSAYDWDLV